MTVDTEAESSHSPDVTPRIWRAGRQDVALLSALKEEVVDATWGRDYPTTALEAWKARFTSPAYFAERLAPSADRPLTKFFIAGPSSAPDGMVALKVRDGRAYIGDLYVRTSGRGIARQLLEHAEAEAQALGLHEAVADVFESNRAAYELLVSDGFRKDDEYVEESLGTRVLRLSRALAQDRLRAGA